MRGFKLDQFGIEHLRLCDLKSPVPGRGEIILEVKALSLNYRDLLVIKGLYNPKLSLPVVPVSDGAGVVSAVGEGVDTVAVGDPVVTHFVADWIDGPFREEYIRGSLGTPGPGLAAEHVALPSHAVVPIPAGLDFAQAATLPIAALTAWSSMVTSGAVKGGETILTLGTGGVSIFVVRLAQAMGASVIITSQSDEKLLRARDLGASHTINYKAVPRWESAVLDLTGGHGVDLTVETGGVGTLSQSLKATRAGGTIAMLGALTGLQGEVNIAPVLMKRLHVCGIYVDCREAFLAMNRFIEKHDIVPVIDRTFPFEALPEALAHMASGSHFGKIVVTL